MRFRFCGDLDCPDWVLAEMSILAKMTSIKLKLFSAQVLQELLGRSIDYEKINKLTADAKFEQGDVKAAIAVLAFIISSAAKYFVDEHSLSNELQQLGLPKEHAAVLCKLHLDSATLLQEEFRRKSLRASQLEGIGWNVDYVISSSSLKDVNRPFVELELTVCDAETRVAEELAVAMADDKFKLLLSELKQAREAMKSAVL